MEQVDLSINQIVEPSVKCWVRHERNHEWMEGKLLSIDNRRNVGSYEVEIVGIGLDLYRYCTLENPNNKKDLRASLFTIEDKLECKCGNNEFAVYNRFGSGGSGHYYMFVCESCGRGIYHDYDNPYYEG